MFAVVAVAKADDHTRCANAALMEVLFRVWIFAMLAVPPKLRS
jgi:hypothetical protein